MNDSLSPQALTIGDRCRVTAGKHAGATGVVFGWNGEKVKVRSDEHGTIKSFDPSALELIPCLLPVVEQLTAIDGFTGDPEWMTPAPQETPQSVEILGGVELLKEPLTKKPTERMTLLALQEQLGGRREVPTPAGRIDLLTETDLIEVKDCYFWKHGLGQVLVYKSFYPNHQPRLHLFGKVARSQINVIENICSHSKVSVTWADTISISEDVDVTEVYEVLNVLQALRGRLAATALSDCWLESAGADRIRMQYYKSSGKPAEYIDTKDVPELRDRIAAGRALKHCDALIHYLGNETA